VPITTLYGPPNQLIQPGDLFAKVPFLFPLPVTEFYRQEEDGDPRLHRMFYEGELPNGARQSERVAMDRRLVFAMLDPTTPGCQINKVIPDDPAQKRPAFSEDRVLTLLHCVQRGEVQRDWDDKRKNGGHKRLGFLGPITLPNEEVVELAVSFRRNQQFLARDVERFERIASPLDDVEGTHAANLIIYALEQFRTEGDPKAQEA
jgi:hypothetical protein